MVFQTNASGIFQEEHRTSDIFIESLPLAVPFSKALEGSKSYNVTETRLGPKIRSKFTSD
jgi:hypothetical protein